MNENSIEWQFGEAEATVVDCGATREGLPEWEDDDMFLHHWIYEYQYPLLGTNETRTHRATIQFIASAYGQWFLKYPKDFKFRVRFNRVDPTQYIGLHNFD